MGRDCINAGRDAVIIMLEISIKFVFIISKKIFRIVNEPKWLPLNNALESK